MNLTPNTAIPGVGRWGGGGGGGVRGRSCHNLWPRHCHRRSTSNATIVGWVGGGEGSGGGGSGKASITLAKTVTDDEHQTVYSGGGGGGRAKLHNSCQDSHR